MYLCLGCTEGRGNVPRSDSLVFGLASIGAFEKKKFTVGSRISAEAIVFVDDRATLEIDIGKGRRANLRMERKRMARSQYQNGCLFVRGKRRKVWVARWREDVILADGTADRVMRSVVLGPVSEIAGRREARRLLDAHLNPVNQGQYRPEGTMLFSQFIADCFEPGVLPTLKYATREIYSLLLRKHLLPRFGQHRLCDISRAEVQHYLLEKLKQGFAWETTNHLRHLLSKVMGTAVNWDYVLNNPVRGVKMPERTLKRPHRFLTAEDVRRLIAASNEPLRTIIILATMTGLRIGEILALRWGRIDLLRGTLHVAETCYKGHFGSPKTRASRREVPLAAAVVRELMSLHSRSAEISQEALVFSKSQGLPLAADNLRKKALRTACKRAGLQRIDWHTLRHTHGTLLHSQGTPLKVAQAQLGHSHMATTLDIYTHASASAQRDAVNLLEGQLFPNVPKLESGGKIAETKSQLVQ
jgi:integrase